MMKRTLTGFSVAAAFACAVTLSAQSSTTPGGADQRSTTARSEARGDMAIVGCLAKDASGNYTLTNAMVSPSGSSATASAAPAAPATTTGTSGSTAAGASTTASASSPASGSSAHMTWRLNGSNAELDRHVGHQIQVTGTQVASASATTSAASEAPRSNPTETTTLPTGTSGVSASANQSLNVKSVTMISASCS